MRHNLMLLPICLMLAGCTAPAQQTTPNTTAAREPAPSAQTQTDPASATSETAGQAARPLTPDTLAKLLAITNERRDQIIKPEPDTDQVSDWKIGDLEPTFDISSVEMDFRPSFSESDIYTPEQAKADLDYLFYFYELGYGPYFYFGGKEAFDGAKAAILADLEQMDEITAPAFEASLIKHLSFVEDAHFVINQNYNHPRPQGYLTDLSFFRDSLGFTESESGKRVTAINGHETFADDMVLSVSPSGQISYRYCVMTEEQPAPSTVKYEDETTVNTAFFSSHEAAAKPEEREDIVSFTRIDDIPVITVTSMGFPHANDDGEANKFLELATELKDEPVLIIDLRHNNGGNGLLPQMWYEAYTGSYMTPNHYNLFRMDLYNAFDVKLSDPDPESFYYIPANVNEHYTHPQTINESWSLQKSDPRQVIDNDRLLIILTSKSTASAADNFTDLAFNVKNSLVIGSNTTGMVVSSAALGIKMPNSGMVGQMGFNLSVFDSHHFQEGTGLKPDLWASGNALEAGLSLAKQHLNEQ